MRSDDEAGWLGAFEQLVLLAVARLDEEAYGMTVRREIEQRAGRPVSLGAVYATVDRLERKGFLEVRAAADERAAGGGRPRRLLAVSAEGTRALRRSLEMVDRMRADVRGLEPMGAKR